MPLFLGGQHKPGPGLELEMAGMNRQPKYSRRKRKSVFLIVKGNGTIQKSKKNRFIQINDNIFLNGFMNRVVWNPKSDYTSAEQNDKCIQSLLLNSAIIASATNRQVRN